MQSLLSSDRSTALSAKVVIMRFSPKRGFDATGCYAPFPRLLSHGERHRISLRSRGSIVRLIPSVTPPEATSVPTSPRPESASSPPTSTPPPEAATATTVEAVNVHALLGHLCTSISDREGRHHTQVLFFQGATVILASNQRPVLISHEAILGETCVNIP